MEVPLSWLEDYVEATLPAEELAARLTFAGLEVEGITYLGLAPEHSPGQAATVPAGAGGSLGGLVWEREKIVVGEVLEVMPHPNADRLVLCRLRDGHGEHSVLTGAPNLFPYMGQGPLARPLKVAYAREGAQLYNGQEPGRVLTTLRRLKIRGVESSSMICSEKELGISEEHEGVMILEEEAPTGMPLADFMGDIIFSVKINPNMARAACLVGVAREVAALTHQKLRSPSFQFHGSGPGLRTHLRLEMLRTDLNPRFTAALVRGVKVGPSPQWMQRRLQRAGMRPINNVVDITNYVMLETGQPLHAFDWDMLMRRSGGERVQITTRLAEQGERLITLDGVERQLEDYMILVCDAGGPLSIAGVMGGRESEVTQGTTQVLLEGAAWDFISIRRTLQALRLPSEASLRFSRGVHPAMTLPAVARAASLMHSVVGGVVARDLVDAYPQKAPLVKVDLPLERVHALLGVAIPEAEIVRILVSLGFACTEVEGPHRGPGGKGARTRLRREAARLLRVTVPDHRLDIGEGVVGQADLVEEIARIHGYERIPEAQMASLLPRQRDNPSLIQEERVRDLLVGLGLQEVITYRLTSPEREAQLLPAGNAASSGASAGYVEIVNPITPERRVMRRSLLASVTEAAARHIGLRDRTALFEIGPVFLPRPGDLPEEPLRLAIVLSGRREPAHWSNGGSAPMDFYDLKGILEALGQGLHLEGLAFAQAERASFHAGKCAAVLVGGQELGVFGELHPTVAEQYGFDQPVLAAEVELDLLRAHIRERYPLKALPTYPPVLEDLAVLLDEDIAADRVLEVMRRAGGPLLKGIRLFDVYRGEQVEQGKRSLAFSVAYQAEDRTLTAAEAAEVRARIVAALEQELGARLRSA